VERNSETEATGREQYLTFFVAGEEYGLRILRVREIIQYEGVTRIPRTPAWVRGVINLRGSVVPVVDLRSRFGSEGAQPTRSTCVVLAEVQFEGQRVIMGLLTDAVSAVMELPEQDLRPVPSFGTRTRIEYLQGLARVGDRLILLLDVDALLSAEEVAQASSLADEASAA
jgi:purine-binding chemotaxis protein CheW